MVVAVGDVQIRLDEWNRITGEIDGPIDADLALAVGEFVTRLDQTIADDFRAYGIYHPIPMFQEIVAACTAVQAQLPGGGHNLRLGRVIHLHAEQTLLQRHHAAAHGFLAGWAAALAMVANQGVEG